MGNCGLIAGAFSSTSGKADKTLDTNGQILYYNSGRQALNIGDEGKVLTVSNSDLPAWETASSKASSYLETVYTLTSVPKKHFVEFFSSDGTVPARWSSFATGTGANSMPSGDNEGISMITGTDASSDAGINFNTISNFDFGDSSCIFITEMTNIGNYETYQGFSNTNAPGSGKGAWLYANDNNSKFQLGTSGGSFTFTASSIDVDTAGHVFQLVLASASVKLYIDGVLRVTNTANLPDAVLQPFMNLVTQDTTSRTLKCIYYEAWNI